MERQAKHEQVVQLRDELKDVSSIFLCNFNGLTVDKDTELRRKMRENGATYKVVKNTMLRLAFEGTDFDQVKDHLKGNTALAHNTSDVVGLAKLIKEFGDANAKFEFKTGVVEGKVIDATELKALATLPPKEQLVAKLMFMLNYPIQGLVTALSGLPRNLAIVLDQVKQQKEQNS
jgi:large subunit ribosomal protein L10